MKTQSTNVSPTLPDLIKRYKQLTQEVINFDLFNQMVHTHHSTAIEGSTLTLLETQTLLEKGLTAGGKPLQDHLMVLNHQQAQTMVLEWAKFRRPLNRSMLQELGAAVMQQTGGPTNTILGTFDSTKGEFRLVGVSAGQRQFMDARKVPTAVDTLLKEINTAITEAQTVRQVYDLSFQAHYQLVTIHPFGDGNGRSSRLLMNYVQQYHNLPLSLVYAQDRTAYVNALEATRRQENLQPLNQFMYGQLTKFLTQEIDRISQQQSPKETPKRKGGLSLLF